MRQTILEDLQQAIDVLNRTTGSPMEPWDRLDYDTGSTGFSKIKHNPGNFHLDSAYGGYALVRTSEGGGEEVIIARTSKPQLLCLVQVYIAGVSLGKMLARKEE